MKVEKTLEKVKVTQQKSHDIRDKQVQLVDMQVVTLI